MQLSKLRKHQRKILPAHIKFKYMSLGVILAPTPILSAQQPDPKSMHLSINEQSQQEIPLPEFTNELPPLTGTKNANRIYNLFLEEVRTNFDDGKQTHSQTSGQLPKLEKQEGWARKNKSNSKKRWVSIVGKSMIRLYAQADKAHEIKKFRLAKVEKQIEKLLVESHTLYMQKMELKKALEQSSRIILVEKENSQGVVKATQDVNPINFDQQNQKLHKLSERIARVKQSIQKREIEEMKLAEASRSLVTEKVQFLMALLKNGYHQSDGIWWILGKLAKNNQLLNSNNFPDIIDSQTKLLILAEYESFKKAKNKQLGVLPKITQGERQKEYLIKSASSSLHQDGYQKLMEISPEGKTSNIYREAKRYIVDWVRKERWKIRSLKHRQLEDESHFSRKIDWMSGEIKRLKKAYPKQKCDQMLEYIFGTNTPQKSGLILFDSLEVVGKEKISNQESVGHSVYRSVDRLSRSNTAN